MASSHSGVAVALLCGHGEFGDRVRESMGALGASVVYEAEPQAFDRTALERSEANVVVVNLDAHSDADLDGVYELLDDARYRVVFNDDEVSVGLTGWDQARWMRHLAAKIIGDANIDPPRPADAKSVPVNTATQYRSAADAHGVEAVVATAAATGVGEVWRLGVTDPVSSPAVTPEGHVASTGAGDFDAGVDGADAAPVAPRWNAPEASTPSLSNGNTAEVHQAIDAVDLAGFDDLALDFDADARAVPPPLPARIGAPAETDFDLDSLAFDAPDDAETAAMSVQGNSSAEPGFDLEALDFDMFGTAAAVPAPAAADPSAGHDIDLDALDFDSIAASGSVSGFDFEAEPEPESAAHAVVDAEVKPVSHVATPAVESSSSADVMPHLAFASNEWTLEDVLDDAPAVPSFPTGPATFGIEKLSAEDFLAPDVEVNEAHPFEMPQSLSLELIPLDEAIAPIQTEALSHENWLDPQAAKPKVRRVWVLGASIGGPEAVREFLTELPRDYPALFVLAQHLGDEFVDMMAKQLAQATALTVRTPIHGARVGHGEVVIVPNGKRLLIDSMGVVVLERDTEERAFSPSIDRVLRDMADRFGSNAGAIVFSGMTDDSVDGCEYLAQKGGIVYAQRQDTCVVSTMIDGVCAAGIVSFQGSPQELAEKLIAG